MRCYFAMDICMYANAHVYLLFYFVIEDSGVAVKDCENSNIAEVLRNNNNITTFYHYISDVKHNFSHT